MYKSKSPFPYRFAKKPATTATAATTKQSAITFTQPPPPPPPPGHLTEEQKTAIRNVAYLGQKGYTIPKEHLSRDEIAFLKKDLFKIPCLNGLPNKEAGFAVYRENEKKIYLPRFYGISRYGGQPHRSEIQEGTDISVEFKGTLQPHQTEAVAVYHSVVQPTKQGGGILELSCGMGKTVLALKLVADLHKKTIILVHKEFLMEQWISRIREFLPTAIVGKLQGKKRELEGVDICIGMIQSIFNKDFPAGTFSEFGLTIIDEVHRIGSSEFSASLTKIITPYMLGISATVERKDQLSNVLFMFIGPKIHSILRSNDETVYVRAIEYLTYDAEYNKQELDYSGKVKYSTMLSKICAYSPRSDFIVRVIRDLFAENPHKQMIILGHYRSLLVYLYEILSVPSAENPTVGYYVGGMKQFKLDESETKQVVLATFAMAAEALDIKSLTTLIMITPKTDIIQSVGRILRTSHAQPIIVDIIDNHGCFQNQWIKRRTYYKKCNYKITKTTSVLYPEGWKNVFVPKSCNNLAPTQTTNAEADDEDDTVSTNDDDAIDDDKFNVDSIVF